MKVLIGTKNPGKIKGATQKRRNEVLNKYLFD